MAGEDQDSPEQAGDEQDSGPRLVLQKIYVRDASFEAPAAPEIFRTEWNPTINVDLNSRAEQIDDSNRQVVLHVTVTATQDDQTAFLAEVQQAGIFTIEGFADDQLGPLLGSYCPATLFPFAREVVADLVTKGGFPQVLLAPVNFDAVYRDQVEKKRGESGDGNGAGRTDA